MCRLGHVEANPVFKGANRATMTVTKAAVAAATIYIGQKVWKKNKVAAVTLMAVSNGILTAVVANNAGVIGRTPR